MINHFPILSYWAEIQCRYFFDANEETHGCASASEPGYAQMEWLRVRLAEMRQRGLKVILIGHVPPARTESKASWQDSCWLKYMVWIRQYRDVIIGSMYGHMNIDHFILQDSTQTKNLNINGGSVELDDQRVASSDGFSAQSTAEYLTELREEWARLPRPPNLSAKLESSFLGRQHKSGREHEMEKYLKSIGGEWAERFALAYISPSVIPNYFPSLRILEYNITGLEPTTPDDLMTSPADELQSDMPGGLDDDFMAASSSTGTSTNRYNQDAASEHSSDHAKFKIPDPPSKSTPPGPAYSPQTLTLLGYIQYFANLTDLNNDFVDSQHVIIIIIITCY